MSHRFLSCTPADLDLLRPLALTTFWDTYGSLNSPRNLCGYLSAAFAENRLKEELSHPDSSFFLLKTDQIPIGYFKLNAGPAQTESMPDDYLEIERIYLLASRQGMGWGKIMIEFIKEIASEKRKNVIWLGVWEKNPNAIAFYRRQGFVEFGKHQFVVGADPQTDVMMKFVGGKT